MLLNAKQLCLYNDKHYIFSHPDSGTFSTIDFTISGFTSYIHYSWKINNDSCRNDQFSSLLESQDSQPEKPNIM